VKLRPGTWLRSQVDTTEVTVVRPGAADVVAACGGHPVIDVQASPGAGIAPVGEPGESTKLGKPYTAAEDAGLELLAIKPGTWCLTGDGVPVRLKEAMPPPASD
jgi:hypothetical protein